MRWPWQKDPEEDKKRLEAWAAITNVEAATKRLNSVLDRADDTLDDAKDVLTNAKQSREAD